MHLGSKYLFPSAHFNLEILPLHTTNFLKFINSPSKSSLPLLPPGHHQPPKIPGDIFSDKYWQQLGVLFFFVYISLHSFCHHLCLWLLYFVPKLLSKIPGFPINSSFPTFIFEEFLRGLELGSKRYCISWHRSEYEWNRVCWRSGLMARFQKDLRGNSRTLAFTHPTYPKSRGSQTYSPDPQLQQQQGRFQRMLFWRKHKSLEMLSRYWYLGFLHRKVSSLPNQPTVNFH